MINKESHMSFGLKTKLLTAYSSFMFNSEDDSGMFAQILHIESVPQDICSSYWVISLTEYRAGLILCSEFEHEMPVFYRMKKILGSYFLVKKAYG